MVIQPRMSMSVMRHVSEVFTNGSMIENYYDEEAKEQEEREKRLVMKMI